jgi:hypothetical protein
MTQYLLTVHMVEGAPEPSPQEMQKAYADVDTLNTQIQAAGAWVFAGGLHPPTIATVVRASGEELVVTDGPFVAGKEHVGGFWIIDVADLDAALAWAGKATVACNAPVEVRPFQDMPAE